MACGVKETSSASEAVLSGALKRAYDLIDVQCHLETVIKPEDVATVLLRLGYTQGAALNGWLGWDPGVWRDFFFVWCRYSADPQDRTCVLCHWVHNRPKWLYGHNDILDAALADLGAVQAFMSSLQPSPQLFQMQARLRAAASCDTSSLSDARRAEMQSELRRDLTHALMLLRCLCTSSAITVNIPKP